MPDIFFFFFFGSPYPRPLTSLLEDCIVELGPFPMVTGEGLFTFQDNHTGWKWQEMKAIVETRKAQVLTWSGKREFSDKKHRWVPVVVGSCENQVLKPSKNKGHCSQPTTSNTESLNKENDANWQNRARGLCWEHRYPWQEPGGLRGISQPWCQLLDLTCSAPQDWWMDSSLPHKGARRTEGPLSAPVPAPGRYLLCSPREMALPLRLQPLPRSLTHLAFSVVFTPHSPWSSPFIIYQCPARKCKGGCVHTC